MFVSLLKQLWPFGRSEMVASPAAVELVSRLHFELVPMASVDGAVDELPDAAHVSVTCSPAKGIAATRELTERLAAAGYYCVPHLAARSVTAPGEAVELAAWASGLELDEVFVIAGDAPEPAGPYEGSYEFLGDFLGAAPTVGRIGIAGYPDGHALIPDEVLHEQLHAKQQLLADHGVGGWVSTQMCFNAETTRSWIERERAAGLTLPIRLGIPGVVDRARLMTMGARLGIGASLRYLSKNRSTVMSMLAPGGYDPTELVAALADDHDALGIEALHCFTFNSVAETVVWQRTLESQIAV